ncbi:hypothetical protein [Nocardia sp. NRRL S-836]|uniref:hypothetical protein n=1 Tax=Nocardia sp. NRRL S-836 TaxID=1519492 RepID=UPI00350FD50E
MLPGADGFEVCRHIRTGDTVPVILLTARGDAVDVLGRLGVRRRRLRRETGRARGCSARS